jgi:hypothetical protein
MGYAKPSMTTIFALDAVDTNDLAASLNDAHKASKLARYAVEGLIMKAEHCDVDADDLNLIQEAIYTAESHVWNAQKLHEQAEQAPAAVHPPLGEPLTHGERVADCPVCGAAILNGGIALPCDRCDVQMHGECYFGRVATLAEWQEYMRQSNGGPADYVPAVVCGQCRAKAEGKP